MKTYLLTLTATILFTGSMLMAQTTALAPNQNPDYAVSRAKYMKVSDSLTRWHSSTQQETYKAIDWLADRREARADRREFRRQLRTQRAGWYNDYSNEYYYPSSYRSRWGNNYGNYYNNGYYRRNNSFYINPWGTGYRWW